MEFNPDKAEWIGDEQDGCYVQVEGQDSEWYCTVVVDSGTGAFVEDLYTNHGPFETKDEALEWGHCQATEWCLTNEVEVE